jgi:stearoyl-CoA desaturase (Delta-9 desaturase)
MKTVPELWIQRAQLAMQFKRMEAAIEKRRARGADEQIERLKARVAEEYASFRRALEEWSKLRDQWVTDRKQRLLQRWEETSFRSRMREIEHSLRAQRRRLQVMTKAYV